MRPCAFNKSNLIIGRVQESCNVETTVVLCYRELEESSDESDTEAEQDVYSSSMKADKQHDLMMKSEGKTRSGFFKQAKKAYPMFPMVEERIRWDDYGEIIR